MDGIKQSYSNVLKELASAAVAANRNAGSVRLLAVSKRQSITAIREVAALGQTAFGENYLQEAEEKIVALRDLGLEWHFIGAVQSNKTAAISSLFDWIHTVDRAKIARRLSAQRERASDLNVCVQFNVSGETSKSGAAIEELKDLVALIRELPQLKLRGLMALPAPSADYQVQLAAFHRVREVYDDVIGGQVDTLSMGTSGDFRAAIAAGSTMVRIGTALFGARI